MHTETRFFNFITKITLWFSLIIANIERLIIMQYGFYP